jgi:hypothetical protein
LAGGVAVTLLRFREPPRPHDSQQFPVNGVQIQQRALAANAMFDNVQKFSGKRGKSLTRWSNSGLIFRCSCEYIGTLRAGLGSKCFGSVSHLPEGTTAVAAIEDHDFASCAAVQQQIAHLAVLNCSIHALRIRPNMRQM